ncbi:rhomboid family intramembrane serine protease [Chitinophaga lutea]
MNEYRPGGLRLLPLVIKNLLIINGLMFLADITLDNLYGIKLADTLGLHYWGSDLFRPHQVVTHLFMHGNALHLFSNMFALWMFGTILENRWGPKRFLIFYMICGIGAAACHMAVLTYDNVSLSKAVEAYSLNPSLDAFTHLIRKYDLGDISFAIPGSPGRYSLESIAESWAAQPQYQAQMIEYSKLYLPQVAGAYRDVATVGASGAVFGVLFAVGYLYPNMELLLYFAIPIKMKYFVAGYMALELYAGIQNSAGDNVAHFAHLGGALFAFLLLRKWNKRNRRTLY